MDNEEEAKPRSQKISKELLESLKAGLSANKLPSQLEHQGSSPSQPPPFGQPPEQSMHSMHSMPPYPFPPAFPVMDEKFVQQMKKQGMWPPQMMMMPPPGFIPAPSSKPYNQYGNKPSMSAASSPQIDNRKSSPYRRTPQRARLQKDFSRNEFSQDYSTSRQQRNLPSRIRSPSRYQETRCRTCGGITADYGCYRCNPTRGQEGYSPRIMTPERRRDDYTRPSRYQYTRDFVNGPSHYMHGMYQPNYRLKASRLSKSPLRGRGAEYSLDYTTLGLSKSRQRFSPDWMHRY